MDFYGAISESLAEAFWSEVNEAFQEIVKNPKSHHFDSSGLRRYNLERFPYNALYLEKEDRIRVQVIRHNSRRSSYGLRRNRG